MTTRPPHRSTSACAPITGRGAVTTRTYPTDDALGVAVFCRKAKAEGGAVPEGGDAVSVLALDVWGMDSIWVDRV